MLRATVLCRPARTNKSPYVCEIVVDGTDAPALCHSPGLGCSGLVAAGRSVWVIPNLSLTTKTHYTAQVAECTDTEGTYRVGIHPLASQRQARPFLDKLGLGPGIEWKAEAFVDDHTRLDYLGTQADGRKIYVEVKNAMISHEADTEPRATRKAIFPEGFRKKKTDPVSPRAVKHANTLAALAAKPDTAAAILLFVLPRDDCGGGLIINPTDKVYSEAIMGALKAGVQIRVFSLASGLELPLFVPGVRCKVRAKRWKDEESFANNLA
jgi:DNA-binding sugar fermentation-stimulating protein